MVQGGTTAGSSPASPASGVTRRDLLSWAPFALAGAVWLTDRTPADAVGLAPGAGAGKPSTPVPATPAPTPPKPPAKPAPSANPKLPIRAGSSRADVRALQLRLSELGYWVGTSNGYYGLTTSQAVMALQKAAGLRRTGVCDTATWKALRRRIRPRPRSKRGHVIEVSKAKQLLMVVDNGKITRIVNTSTGARGMTTPSGTWRFTRSANGWETPMMYRTRYFYRGYAVHGSPSVPGYPASHGCCRVTPAAMDMLVTTKAIRKGDPITIY